MKIRAANLPLKRRRGFTVLEAIITLAILGLMVGLASPSFLNLTSKYRLKRAVWEINTRMNFARYKAVFDGTKVRITFDSAGYVLEKYNEPLKTWKKLREYYLEGVKLHANNSPIFHPGGTVSHLASIYVSNPQGKYRITLALSGRIKTVKLQ